MCRIAQTLKIMKTFTRQMLMETTKIKKLQMDITQKYTHYNSKATSFDLCHALRRTANMKASHS